MAIMAAFELFLAEEAAAAGVAEAVGASLGADALAATALTAGEMAGLGATVGEGAAAAEGITQASMAADAAAGGGGAGQAGINAAQVGTQQGAAAQIANSGLPPGFDQQLQNIQNMSQGPSVQVASNVPGAGLDSLQTSSNISDAAMRAGTNPSIPSGVTDQMLSSGYTPPAPVAPPVAPSSPFNYSGPIEQGTPHPMMRDAYTTPLPDTRSSLMKGLDSVTDWAKKNPFPAMATAYTGANMLGLLKPSGETFNEKGYDGPLNRYRLSPDFKPGSANPEDYQYTPRRYAGGGVMGVDPNTISVGYEQGGQMPETQNYARGGSLSDSIESYQKMLSGKPMAPPARSADVGIYYDQDPDTRYQDALTAAQIRQAKVNQRAYVSPPVAKRPTPMGQLQMASVKPRKQGDGGGDVEAARGGIMQSYADGGITGDGNLNLQIPLNLGGGGGGAGGGFGGYTPAGGGNVNPNTGGGGFGGLGGGGKPQDGFGGLAGLLGGANPLAAELQKLQRMQQMDQPYGGGILGRSDLVAPAVMPSMPVGGRGPQSYEQYLAGRNPMQQDVQMTREQYQNMSEQTKAIPQYQAYAYAQGGITSLGGYAAGGNPRLLRGPGDGMSDNIPATINGRQPARLADGEFVIPADVVSHLGNGSTEAGAKQLHAMMDKVRSARTGNKKQGRQIKPQKYMPK